jgi:hypothetical protein
MTCSSSGFCVGSCGKGEDDRVEVMAGTKKELRHLILGDEEEVSNPQHGSVQKDTILTVAVGVLLAVTVVLSAALFVHWYRPTKRSSYSTLN